MKKDTRDKEMRKSEKVIWNESGKKTDEGGPCRGSSLQICLFLDLNGLWGSER